MINLKAGFDNITERRKKLKLLKSKTALYLDEVNSMNDLDILNCVFTQEVYCFFDVAMLTELMATFYTKTFNNIFIARSDCKKIIKYDVDTDLEYSTTGVSYYIDGFLCENKYPLVIGEVSTLEKRDVNMVHVINVIRKVTNNVDELKVGSYFLKALYDFRVSNDLQDFTYNDGYAVINSLFTENSNFESICGYHIRK